MALPEEPTSPRQAQATLENTKLLLEGLAAQNLEDRRSAAAATHALGRQLIVQAARNWLDDAELASLFVTSEEGFPETTVGVAVEPSRFEAIRLANGSPRLADVPPDIDAKEFELHFSGGVQIDILTTRDRESEGTIARFLKRNGEGIQQVELAVRDVERATAILQSRMGLIPVYPNARTGANGTLVNFFLVDFLMPAGNKKKLLIELVQTKGSRQ